MIEILEVLFKQIPGLERSPMAKRIRIRTIYLFTSSMEHERACGQKECMFALSQRSNMAVAYGVTELVLSSLYKNPDDLAELTGGTVQPPQIREQLSKVKALQLQPSGHSQLQQVTSAIGIISNWGPSDACKPCRVAEPTPPELLLPPSVVQMQEEVGGKRVTADPTDSSVKLRLQIQATANLSSTRGEVRNMALKYLAAPQIIAELTGTEHAAWDVQLIACLLIFAVESKLEKEDSTQQLRANLLEAESISAHTFLASAGAIEVLMRRFPPPLTPNEEHDLYECEAAREAGAKRPAQ